MAGLLTFGNVLLERGELVEVRGEETEASNLVDDVPGGRKRIRAMATMTEREKEADGGGVLGDGPGEAKAVVGARAAAQLVDDDQRALCRSLQNGRRLLHLGHERRHSPLSSKQIIT